jgi:hypothetical protein
MASFFLDHKNFPFLKAIERKAEGGGNQSVQHMEYSQIFILFYLFLGSTRAPPTGQAIGTPHWTSNGTPKSSSLAEDPSQGVSPVSLHWV